MAETVVEPHEHYLGSLVKEVRQSKSGCDHNDNPTLQYGTAVSEW